MRNPVTWIAIAIMGLALALRLYGIDWGLPQVYEEAYPLKKAWPMWGWADGESFTLDPRFFNYPTFYLYLQLLGQAVLYGLLWSADKIESAIDFQLLYTLDPTPFYLMGRSLTTAFAVATVGLTFMIGKRIAGLAVGSMAAILVALNGFHIAKSQAIEVDIPLTFFVMATGWFAMQIPDSPRLRNYLWAGLLAGLATSTKYSGGLLPLMILLSHVVALLRNNRSNTVPAVAVVAVAAPRAASKKRSRQKPRKSSEVDHEPNASRLSLASFFQADTRILWRNLLLAGVVCIAALLLTSPYILLDWSAFTDGFSYERTHMKTGHFGLDATPAILWYARVMTDQILGWPLSILALMGLVWVVAVQRRAWAAILAIFPLVYILILSSWSMKAARYIMPVLPIACLMASVLISQILQRLTRLTPSLRAVAAAVLVVAIALPAMAEYQSVLRRARGDTRTVSRQWILDNIPAGAYLVSEAYGPEPFNAIVLVDMNVELREAMRERHSDVPVYGLLQIPMLQVVSEHVAPFYELEQYYSSDYLITTSSVRQRYLNEPQRYSAMVRFYQQLESDWPLVKVFDNHSMTGPEIRIYKNPQQDTILGDRGKVRAPASLPRLENTGSGLVAPQMQRIGANLETFGYVVAAAEAFELALTYPPLTDDVERSCVLRAMQARLRSGDRDRALRLLEAALAGAKTPQQRQMWERLRTRHFESPASDETP